MDSHRKQIQQHTSDSDARKRITKLLDKDSFVEFHAFVKSRIVESDKLVNDGVVTGAGLINQRKVFIYAQNFLEMGGSLGEMQARKIVYVYELALKTGCPVISMLNSVGARIQEGIHSLDGYGEIFKRIVRASGKLPQISIVTGPCAGGAAYSSALTDFVFLIKDKSQMFITGPKIIDSVMGEKIGIEELGGAKIHSETSGVAHFLSKDEDCCFAKVRQLLEYLPPNNLDDPPIYFSDDSSDRYCENLEAIVPSDSSKTYDILRVITSIFDDQSFLEIQKDYARNVVVGLARLMGKTVGVVATQPRVKAGCLDINSSTKIAKFVQFCDCFNVPIINLVDVPGYLPGVSEEKGGIIRHGAKLLYAYGDAQVPKISIILRKAYGGAYIAMASKGLGYDCVLAWPEAEIGVMGAKQALYLFKADEITKMSKKDFEMKLQEYNNEHLNIYKAAGTDKIDKLIERRETRKVLISILNVLGSKTYVSTGRRHGNIPL